MESTKRKLVTLNVSPWSERARWALDHHRLAYRNIDHVPFLGERRLRKLVGPGKQRATVPVLVSGGEVISESWDIAVYADREGKGPALIPSDRMAEVRQWNDMADQAMSAGRALTVASLLATPGALDEGLPDNVPGFLRVMLRPMTRYGTKWFARKYDLGLENQAPMVAKLREALTTLRNALAGARYLLTGGSFSYADIVAASLLQGISPVDDRYLRIGPATRAAWTHHDLAEEFADLIHWRDRLYEQHRVENDL
jgi:glutathione S-transferase